MTPFYSILFSLPQTTLVMGFLVVCFSKYSSATPATGRVFFFDASFSLARTPLKFGGVTLLLTRLSAEILTFFFNPNKCFYGALFRDRLCFFEGFYSHRKRTIPRNRAIF